MRSRRGVLGAALALLSSTSLIAACQAKDATPAEASKAKGGADHASHAPAAMSTVAFIEVWKTPNCGCCKLWIKILEK
ncbi:hypothetical protein KIH26_16915, partial [Variovorax sp. PCZ-1]|nr:hypothetical protein [Variovorax sp. PCZ-1]